MAVGPASFMTIDQHIRPLEPTDMPDVKAAIDASGLFLPELLDGMTARYFRGEAQMELWLTYIDRKPVAVAYCAPEPMTLGTWNLLLIAVHPDSQGRGVGTVIMRHVENKLAESGQRLLLVETSSLTSFENTRRFYRKLGYDEEARIRDFYQAGEDKIVFRKALEKSSAE